MFFFTRAEKIVIGVCLTVILICGTVSVGRLVRERSNPPTLVTPSPFPSIEPPQVAVVHVAGRVKKPGVYELPLNTRAIDAIRQAGGPLPSADLDRLNLARLVEDGERLYVPDRSERGEIPVADTVSRESKEKATKPMPKLHSIDLNKASATDLEQLPGVGPKTAELIIKFRKDNGGFRTAEDLLKVRGIGPKKFARMKPYVKVE